MIQYEDNTLDGYSFGKSKHLISFNVQAKEGISSSRCRFIGGNFDAEPTQRQFWENLGKLSLAFGNSLNPCLTIHKQQFFGFCCTATATTLRRVGGGGGRKQGRGNKFVQGVPLHVFMQNTNDTRMNNTASKVSSGT